MMCQPVDSGRLGIRKDGLMALVEELRWRDATPGARLEMVVLAVGDAGCVAVDIASGAYVRPRWPVKGSYDPSISDLVRTGSIRPGPKRRSPRARHPASGSDAPAPHLPASSKEALAGLVPSEEAQGGGAIQHSLEPLQIVTGVLADTQEDVLDPSRPEAVILDGLPSVTKGRHTRLLRRVLRDCVTPPGQALLGFPAPAKAFWDLDGSRGSLALVEVRGGPVLLRRPGEEGLVRARFSWGGAFHELPVLDPALVVASHGTRKAELSGGSLHKRLGWWPRYLVVALTGPRDGYCYRVVASALPYP